MATITHYMVHDPVGNCESYLAEFDSELIARAAESGIIFVAVYDDGTRKVVDSTEVVPPQSADDEFTLLTPVYVDTRTAATVAVFDALAAIVDPESAVATADETGETTGVVDPVENFKAALAELRKLEGCEVAQ